MNPDYPYPFTIDYSDEKNCYRIYDRLMGDYVSDHQTYEDAERWLRYYVFKTTGRRGGRV